MALTLATPNFSYLFNILNIKNTAESYNLLNEVEIGRWHTLFSKKKPSTVMGLTELTDERTDY